VTQNAINLKNGWRPCIGVKYNHVIFVRVTWFWGTDNKLCWRDSILSMKLQLS